MAARKTAKPLSFEDGLKRLEEIAARMESGELPLDDLLKLYEEGVSLSGELTRQLDEAAGRMLEVRQNADGEPVTVAADVVRQESLLDALDENGGNL